MRRPKSHKRGGTGTKRNMTFVTATWRGDTKGFTTTYVLHTVLELAHRTRNPADGGVYRYSSEQRDRYRQPGPVPTQHEHTSCAVERSDACFSRSLCPPGAIAIATTWTSMGHSHGLFAEPLHHGLVVWPVAIP